MRQPVHVLLTGRAAGVLQGIERATLDIDFEVSLKSTTASHRSTSTWASVQKAIDETGRATAITPQYSEDIDHWSAIALPSRRSRLYRRFGKVEVRILEPGLWAIGKLT